MSAEPHVNGHDLARSPQPSENTGTELALPMGQLSNLPPCVGWTIMGAGIILFILPGVPGIPLIVIASGVLATRIRVFGNLDTWVARRFPKAYKNSIAFALRFEGDFRRRFPDTSNQPDA